MEQTENTAANFPRGVRILVADLRAFGGEETDRLIGALPPDRGAALMRFRSERDRARGAVGEALLRLALSKCTGIGPRELSVRRTPEGKPFLEGGPQFNLSHSGDVAVFVSDRFPVGIDVEKLEDFDPSAITARCFSEREREEIARAPFPLAAFYRLWTARESALKKLGAGISRMRELEMYPGHAFLGGKELGVICSRFLFGDGSSANGYALSVCTEGECEEEFFFCGAGEIADAYFAACGADG